MFKTILSLIIAITLVTGCGEDDSVDNPVIETNPHLTQTFADLKTQYGDAPAAPSLTPGIHETQDLHCTNIHGAQFYEWVGILTGSRFLACDLDVGMPDVMVIAHASLVRIPDNQSGLIQYAYVYEPNLNPPPFSFPFTPNRPSIILARTYQALTILANDLGGTATINGLSDFDDWAVKTVDLFSCNGNITRLNPNYVVYETDDAVKTVPVSDVTNLKIPYNIIFINGTETKMLEGFPARFYANEADANAYRDYRRNQRGIIPGNWYSIALFDSSDLTDTIHEKVLQIHPNRFPQTDEAKKAFALDNIEGTFAGVTTHVKFSDKFDEEEGAQAVDWNALAEATEFEHSKFRLRVLKDTQFERVGANGSAYKRFFPSNTVHIGDQAQLVAGNVALYKSSDDIVIGWSGELQPNDPWTVFQSYENDVVIQVSREWFWQFGQGKQAERNAHIAALKSFFGWTSADGWRRGGNTPRPHTRVDPAPYILAYLIPDNGEATKWIADSRRIYKIGKTNSNIRYAHVAGGEQAAQDLDTALKRAASIYTYFDVIQ